MFKDNRIFITEGDTRDDYIGLDLRLDSSHYQWKNAIEMMRRRIEGRYLDPMRALINADANKNGFAAMAICCLLIETLMQFREGFQKTPARMNKKYYTNFLINQLGNEFDRRMADCFYTDIRCGILHSAQTKNNTCLTFDTDYTVAEHVNGVLMVDVKGMEREIRDYFNRYCSELENPNNKDLRENFIRKMDDITNKWAGTSIADNIWFAICAEEKSVIRLQNGNYLMIEVVDHATALRIHVSYNHPGFSATRNKERITKAEIEKALYYWPSETAIKMMDKGEYIFSVLFLYRKVVDDAIAREVV